MTRAARTDLLVAVCALAVACSASEDQPEPSVTPDVSEDTTASPAPDGDEPFPVGVMEGFLAKLGAVGTETPAQQQERMTAYEGVLATCMQEQGFAYTPVDWSYLEEEEVGPPPPRTDIDAADLEFAAEFGYGVSTQDELSAGMAQDAAGFVDPNAEYVASMSPAEQEAYYLEDPRLVTAGQEWSDCMADAGHPGFTSVAGAATSFFDEDMRIIDETFGALAGDPSDASYYTSPEYLAAEQTAARMRSALAERETATAVADLECQAELDYPRLYAEVSAELQAAFYAEHRTDLEAWLAAAEEWEAGR